MTGEVRSLNVWDEVKDECNDEILWSRYSRINGLRLIIDDYDLCLKERNVIWLLRLTFSFRRILLISTSHFVDADSWHFLHQEVDINTRPAWYKKQIDGFSLRTGFCLQSGTEIPWHLDQPLLSTKTNTKTDEGADVFRQAEVSWRVGIRI